VELKLSILAVGHANALSSDCKKVSGRRSDGFGGLGGAKEAARGKISNERHRFGIKSMLIDLMIIESAWW